MSRSFQQHVRGLRQQEIAGASLSVFGEKGCFELKVEDVAKAAGVAKGAIYTHFRSKEELLCAAFEQLQSRVAAEYQRRLGGLPEGSDVLAKLALIAGILLRLDAEAPGFEFSLFHRLPCALSNMRQECRAPAAEEGILSGAHHDTLPAAGLAQVFLGLVSSHPIREMARREGAPQASRAAVDFFLRGAGAANVAKG
ncbi:MAG: TetR/AcrR family transcriptional regulator [Candidatus Solibacter usitatus]|nr:TetR/AcrR family transcriptional regulator [Candidatus Solibacter usitatus]